MNARALALLIAAISGFLALSYEILWYRTISFASWGLPGAFGLLLAAYLIGIAVGARLAGAFCADADATGDRRQLRKLAVFVLVANVAAWLVVPVFGFTAKRWDWPPALLAVGVAAALLGAILPLASHYAVAPDASAGANVSFVYLANIVGSGAGSLVTGFVLLDRCSVQTNGAILAAVGMALVALVVGLSDARPKARVASVGGAFAVAALLVLLTPRFYDRLWERLLFKGRFDDTTRFAEVIETKSGVITVTQDRLVYGGGAYDGKINTSLLYDNNAIQRAFVIGAMHPAPKNVLMVGLASGSWAKVVSNMPGVDHLTVIEINPGYLDLLARHEEVSSVLTDPKVTIAIDDGRRWLQRHDEKFDVIVMNTTFHWRAHATSLLSTDFFEIARAHLTRGGFLYFNATGSEDVQRTAFTSFPYGLRVHNCVAVGDSPIVFDSDRFGRVLTAFRLDGEPVVDLGTAKGRALMSEMLDYGNTLTRAPDPEGLESRESVLARTQSALVITDDNMATEWVKPLRFPEAF